MVATQTYERPQSFHDLVRRLIELGYHPVPIPAGCKGPVINGWQKLHMTVEDVPQYFSQEDMLVGILHENNCFIDIDVYDAELATTIADEAKRRFPGCLERVGQYPKTAIVVGLDECGYKVSNTIRAEAEGLSAQVEIRTLTRQAVAYGKHPDTGQLYKWIGRELWETPVADLPRASKADVQEFRDWADAQIRDWAGIEDDAPSAPPAPQATAQLFSIGMFHTNSMDRATEEQFLEALKHAPADTDYPTWLECLMGIHDFYSGSPAGLAVAQDWSANYAQYNPREVDQKWRSFETGRGIGYKTVFGIAKNSGADLSAIARMGKERAAPLKIETNSATTTAPAFDTGTPEAATEPPQSRLEWYRDVKVVRSNSYLVKGVLDASAMSVLYGPSNSGKTFFGMDIAFHLALGRQWRGRRVKQTSVLYLAAEGGNGAANRVIAFRQESGVQDMPFALRRAGLDLLRSEADLQEIYDLSQEVTAAHPDLPHVIFIDTLSRVMAGGDENTPADMTALIKNLDKLREITQAHIALIHHSGKDTAKGARGHSSLRAATDTEIEIQNDDGYRSALVTKQRDHQGGEDFGFTLKSVEIGIDEDGDVVTSCVVNEADADENRKAKRKLTKNQRILADTFDQMVAGGLGKPNPAGPTMPDPGRFKVLHMDAFRAECEGKMTVKNTRDAFLTAFDALNCSDGIFCMASGFVWRTDRPNK